MKKYLLTLLIAMSACLPTFGQTSTKGLVTVGTGASSGASSGNFNLDQFDDFGKMMKVASHYARHVHLLSGTYTVTAPFVDGTSNLYISGEPGAQLVVANTQSVSLFNLSGDRVLLEGLNISIPTYTASQNTIRFAGKYNTMKNSFINMTATNGDTSTPMGLMLFDNALEPHMDGNTILPNKALQVLTWSYGNGGTFNNNTIRNESLTGFGGVGENLAGETRLGWRVINGVGCQNVQCAWNRIWGLGALTTNEIPAVIMFRRQHTGIDGTLDGPSHDQTGTLQGQIDISHNQINGVAANVFVHLRGVIEFHVDDNIFGSSLDVMDGSTEAAVLLDNETSTDGVSVETGICGSGTVNDNTFNNCAKVNSQASDIKFWRTKKVMAQGNICHISSSTQAFLVNVDKSSTLSIWGNYFDGDQKYSKWGVAFESPGLTYFIRCISIRNNFGEGLRFGICPGRNSINGLAYPAGTTYDDGSMVWGANTSFLGNEVCIVSDAARTAAALTYPPDASPNFETLVDCSASFALVNQNAVAIADKLQRMCSGAYPWNNPLETVAISGATANGSIETVSTLQGCEDNILELANAINTVIGAVYVSGTLTPTTPEIQRLRFMTTITTANATANLGGEANADAYGKLTDSITGTTQAVLPQITDNTSANNAFQTLLDAFNNVVTNLSMNSNMVAPTTANQ